MRNKFIQILCCMLLISAVMMQAVIAAEPQTPPGQKPSNPKQTPQQQEHKPAERYQWAYSSSTQTLQFDTHTVQKINDPYVEEQLVEAWIRVITPDGTRTGKISMHQYYFRLNQKQYQLLASFDLAPDGQQMGPGRSFTYAADRWQDIVPGTMSEGIYSAVTNYAFKKFPPPPKAKGRFLGIF